jgi:aldose 1-epimerase
MTPSSALQDDALATFELHAGALRLALRPDLGGCAAGLWHGDTPVWHSNPAASLRQSSDAACIALVPFANELALRRFRFKGRDHQLAAAPGDAGPHALHGVGWKRPWTWVSHSAFEAVLKQVHQPDADWPFAFEVSQYLNLTPESLGMHLVFTNTDTQAQPVGMGWQMAFPKRQRSRLHVEVASRWDVDNTGLPVRKVAQASIDGDVSHMEFNHVFEGWSGAARVRDEKFSLHLHSSLPYLKLRTSTYSEHFNVQVASHLGNAIHMADPAAHGLRTLQPGERMEVAMSLDVNVV